MPTENLQSFTSLLGISGHQVQALALAPAGLVQCLFGTGPAQARHGHPVRARWKATPALKNICFIMFYYVLLCFIQKAT